MRMMYWSSAVCSSDLSPSVSSCAPRRSPRCRSGAGLLADNDGHRAEVLGIGRFGRTEFGRTFLAIADDVDAARVDAERRQVIFRGVGAALAEGDVVVAGAKAEEHPSELPSIMR